MIKTLLIYPYFIEERLQAEDISVPPIGIYQVAAVLREKRYDVEVYNWHNINKTPEKIREVLGETHPDVIGFSILHANRWGGIEVARIARELDPGVKIVFGGIGATFLWEHLLTHFPEIDYIVIGEGEYTFLNLIQYLGRENEKCLEDIKGIAFREHGEIVKTEDAAPLRDLDQLPIPAEYFNYHHVSSNRGCAWNCAFCGSSKFWGKNVRFRSPDHFVRESALLYDKGTTFFYFSDDTFTIQKGRVIEICRLIIQRGLTITWNAISRVDHVDEEILYWMRKAGCVQISYGIESGSRRIRRRLNKHIRTDQIKTAFESTRKYGILARAYFIYGSPGETWETIQETIDLIHEIKPLGIIFYILDVFPGTDLYAGLQEKFNITDDIWLQEIEGIMHFEAEAELSDDLILAFGEKLRTEFYGNIHKFIESIRLVDKKELYEKHADFYSRLGMTFSHGDYSRIEVVREKDKIAEVLYKRALHYHPDHRAYLGLGIIRQKNREFEESIKILVEGLTFFPHSEEINLCLGLSYMNLREYRKALRHFLQFPHSEEANHYRLKCEMVLKESSL